MGLVSIMSGVSGLVHSVEHRWIGSCEVRGTIRRMRPNDPEIRVRMLEDEVARLARVESRMARLLAVTGALAATHTREHAGRIVVEQGLDAGGHSTGVIWLLAGEAGPLELLGTSSRPAQRRVTWQSLPLELDAPIAEAVRTGQPVIVASPGGPACANLPLRAGGKALGVLAVTYAHGQDLDTSERTFLAILADQYALTLARIEADQRLAVGCRTESEARLQASEETRTREEILAVVSHDLRSPLGTILIGASTLVQSGEADDPTSRRIRGVAERIHRQSERMARLLEDLVDFAGIDAGRLVLARRQAGPGAIVAQAAERVAPVAGERGIRFEHQVAADLPRVDCDPARVAQILASLATNAVKVTSKGGQITMGATAASGEVVFFVRDTGPGIDADELPTLFQRHWRSKNSSYRGAAFGLSLARGVVDAHGGRIWAESEAGAGSTFYFTLTRRT